MFGRTIRTEGKHIECDIDDCIGRINRLLERLQKKERGVLGSIDNVCSQKKTMLLLDFSEKHIVPFSTGHINESDNYDFHEVLDQSEEILLDSYSKHYDSNYLQPLKIASPLEIKVEIRSGWIRRYLDERDCSLWLKNESQQIEIVGIENGILSCLTHNNVSIKMKSTDIYQWNEVIVRFDRHTEGFKIYTIVKESPQVYQINVKKQTRIVFRTQNDIKQIQRLILLKQTPEMDLKYQVAWGNYFQGGLLQDVQLEKGKYILISLGTSPIQEVDLYLVDPELVNFRAASETNHKTRCLLLESFPEVSTNSYIHSDRQIKQEFSRSVYMNLGLVLQIYENIYLNEVLFEEQQAVEQDICLLFQDLYTRRQLQNRLKRGEKMIKFYSVEAKPAFLFVPKKQVRTGSEIMEHYKSHSVFK